MMSDLPSKESTAKQRGLRVSVLQIFATLFLCFVVLGAWLTNDLKQSYDTALADRSYRSMQRSQIISQSFRTEMLATDYVLRDVLGRLQVSDLVYPDPDPAHAQQMTRLLKDKADTVPDFFSMVIFNRDCVFVATHTGQNVGAQSKPELCAQRKAHQAPGPLVSYVSGSNSASGRSVLVLSRHLLSDSGEFLGGVLGVIELEQAQRRFESLIIGPGDSVAMLDEAQILLARSPKLADLVEKTVDIPEFPATLQSGESVAKILPLRDVDGEERMFGFSKVEGLPFVVAYGIDKIRIIKDWRRRAIELSVGYVLLLVLLVIAARYYWMMLCQRDELMASRAALHELATHDPLTGLYNRRFLDATMPREFARSQRDGTPLAVIMLDLDHFKRVNDDYSHAAGDEVLKALAELLKKGARESDLICRYGGEEFIAVMPKMSLDQAWERVEWWRKQLEETRVVYADMKIGVTLSAGIAVFPDHGKSPSELLTRADEMLYKSKREGRNRISVFVPE